MRRQQYRSRWSESSTSFGGSPSSTRFTKSSNALPMTFPHVKHLTGIIMLASPVRFLVLLSSASALGVLRELPPRVRYQERSVILRVHRGEVVISQELHQPLGNGG